MTPVKVFKEEWEVGSRLLDFGTTKDEWVAVVRKAVGAKREALIIHPANAAGQLSYIYGTGAVRDLLCPKGWEIDRTDNIEATYNPQKGIKVIYQNSDSACIEGCDPKAISDKGAASARIIAQSCGNLFPEYEEEDRKKQNSSVWYFCVYAEGDDVRAELSCPRSIIGNQFLGFRERIFIVQRGEWDAVNIKEDDTSPSQDFEITVTRKK